MVVFVDLDHDGDDDDPGNPFGSRHGRRSVTIKARSTTSDQNENQRHTTTQDKVKDSNADVLASVLTCYPASSSIASHLDLNDLFALSSTCRRVHESLTQFACRLRMGSLRCINDGGWQDRVTQRKNQGIFGTSAQERDEQSTDTSEAYQQETAQSPVGAMGVSPWYGFPSSNVGLIGKISQCARDLVSPCRKCGVIVCRNCAVKPPPFRCLPERHRRLCQTCLAAPIEAHLQEFKDPMDHFDGLSLAEQNPHTAASTADDVYDGRAPFAASAFLRTPCECEDRGIHLCQPCGQNLRASNTTYKRVWTWRSRYSTHIGGGLGTGLGQGEQGQKCGRAEHCLEKSAAGICWVEIECSETPFPQSRGLADRSTVDLSSPLRVPSVSHLPEMNKPGYFSQEMEGIGGVVKKKVKKRMKVGATVVEHDDERESGNYLERESSGRERSWCGWCFRVCPGQDDQQQIDPLLYPTCRL